MVNKEGPRSNHLYGAHHGPEASCRLVTLSVQNKMILSYLCVTDSHALLQYAHARLAGSDPRGPLREFQIRAAQYKPVS